MLVKGREIGSDLTLLNTIYQFPSKNDSGKYDKDYILLVYRDNNTKEKKIEIIDEPTYEFYMANNDVAVDHHMFFMPKEDLTIYEVPYSQLNLEIAKMTGNEEFYYDNIKTGNRGNNRRLHSDIKELFNSDMNINDHYRFRFSKEYTNNSYTINKSYMDIETDTINMKGDFPELGECPINTVAYTDDFSQTIYMFILRDPNNQSAVDFERSIGPDLFREVNQFVIDGVGGWKQATRFKVKDLGYEFRFFDTEIDLIHNLFLTIHKNSPDFCNIWNGCGFDLPYIVERVKVLGYDPKEVLCYPGLDKRVCKYYIDMDHINEPEERGSYFNLSGKTVFLDQEINFASRRKGQTKFPSYSLDYIGGVVAKVRKFDWSHIANTFEKFIRKDFKLFVFYNIMDIVTGKCIDIRTGDTDYIFNKCLANNTRYEKGHRQTVYLTNRGIKEFEHNGLIMGNNHNIWNRSENTGGKKKTTFSGALVGDPMKTNNYSKMKVNGMPTMLVNNLDDYDFKSLYPRTEWQHNIGPNTQIGAILIDQIVWNNENRFHKKNYHRPSQFAQDFLSYDYISFSNRYLHLANFKEMIEDMKQFFSMISTMNPVQMNSSIYTDPFIPVGTENDCIDAFYNVDDVDRCITPFVKIVSKIDYSKYIGGYNDADRFAEDIGFNKNI